MGEPFDPQRHEAMAMRESTSAEPQSVLEVVQRGYELNGRLLRPAACRRAPNHLKALEPAAIDPTYGSIN